MKWRRHNSSRYSDSLRSGRSRDRIPVGRQIFHILPDGPWGPPSPLYKGYRVFSWGKAAGAWRSQPTFVLRLDVPPLPPSVFMASSRVNFTFTSQMVDKMSRTQLVRILFIYKVQLKMTTCLVKPFTLGHHQVVSLKRGNHTMRDAICGIRSLLFNIFHMLYHTLYGFLD